MMSRLFDGPAEFIFNLLTDEIVDLRSEEPWRVRPKVGIFAAVVGGFYRRNQNPHQPYTPEEILEECVECVEAGATAVHIHVRNEDGWPSGNLERYRQVVDPLRERYQDNIITDCCSVFRPHSKTVDFLKTGLFETTPINCTATFAGDALLAFTPAHMQAHARAILDAGAVPQLGVYTAGDVDNAYRYLIRPGLVQKPYFWVVLHGMPGLSPMREPIAMAETLILTFRRIREIDQESRIMVCAAGRPAAYTAIAGMMLGADAVRVGKEDTIYRWPHRNDLIKRNVDVVKDMVDLTRILGLEVMNAQEFREHIGLKYPLVVR